MTAALWPAGAAKFMRRADRDGKYGYNSGMQRIENYFDYAATTPLHPLVRSAMEPYLTDRFGNPSAGYAFAQDAFQAVWQAREQLLAHFNAPKGARVVFTGSSTEAANQVIWSRVFDSRAERGDAAGTVLISATEHSAVRNTVYGLARMGFCRAEAIPVDENATVRLDILAEKIRERPILVSIIGANNELGTIQPVAEIAAICRAAEVPFHCDATQLAAHALIDLQAVPIDYLTVSAHKLYGPKGIGAIVARGGASLHPLIFGGSQEAGLRAGTENVAYIAAMAEAYRILRDEFSNRSEDEQRIRDLVIARALSEIPESRLTGHAQRRLSHHASFSFKHVDSLTLQGALDQQGFAVSIGSACRSNRIRGQQQLIEIGLGVDWINGGLRISNGLYSTAESAEALVAALKETVRKLRSFSP